MSSGARREWSMKVIVYKCNWTEFLLPRKIRQFAMKTPKLKTPAKNFSWLRHCKIGGTYVREAVFSRMNCLTNKYRTQLMDNKLGSRIRLKVCAALSWLSVNIQESSH